MQNFHKTALLGCLVFRNNDWLRGVESSLRRRRNPKVNGRDQKTSPLVSTLNQSTPNSISFASTLILSSHLRFDITAYLFPSGLLCSLDLHKGFVWAISATSRNSSDQSKEERNVNRIQESKSCSTSRTTKGPFVSVYRVDSVSADSVWMWYVKCSMLQYRSSQPWDMIR